jgi:hypothetical protein
MRIIAQRVKRHTEEQKNLQVGISSLLSLPGVGLAVAGLFCQISAGILPYSDRFYQSILPYFTKGAIMS